MKNKMTDNEIMTFNEEIMAKINKRKIQPLESLIGKINCNQCNLYGECDHQGAYQKDGKWCYEN